MSTFQLVSMLTQSGVSLIERRIALSMLHDRGFEVFVDHRRVKRWNFE